MQVTVFNSKESVWWDKGLVYRGYKALTGAFRIRVRGLVYCSYNRALLWVEGSGVSPPTVGEHVVGVQAAVGRGPCAPRLQGTVLWPGCQLRLLAPLVAAGQRLSPFSASPQPLRQSRGQSRIG